MAAFSDSRELIPAEFKEPVADFLSSGLHQFERVLRGPRARDKVEHALIFPFSLCRPRILI